MARHVWLMPPCNVQIVFGDDALLGSVPQRSVVNVHKVESSPNFLSCINLAPLVAHLIRSVAPVCAAVVSIGYISPLKPCGDSLSLVLAV